MKKICRSCAFMLPILIAFQVEGQNEFFFGHHMFNPSYFSPGWIGSENEAFLSFNHRTQWAGYNASLDPGGAPTTQMLSLTAPVDGQLGGLGFFFVNDRVGPLTSVQMRAGISVKKEFSFGRVTLGIMPAMNMTSVNAGYFRANDDSDPLIPQGNETQFKPNLHSGILFESRRNFFVSASVENILEPSFSFGTTANNAIERNYYLFGGTRRNLTRNIVFSPYVLLRSDLTSYSYEISSILEYREKMWGGLSFRSSESITVLLGYSFLEENKLRVGYSFDYIVSKSVAKENTSHEIYVRYNLPNLIFAGRKAVKTPRFSF